LRSGFIPLCAPFQPPLHFPARRPQTEAINKAKREVRAATAYRMKVF
jgi:hypothetical protein